MENKTLILGDNMKKESIQVARSRNWIVNALLHLMKEKTFYNISIKEICEKAGVSRLTYYRNFKNKEDIVTYYFDSEFDKIINIIKKIESLSYSQFIELSFKNFQDNIELNKLFFRDNLVYLILIASNRYIKIILDSFFNEVIYNHLELKFIEGGILNIMIDLMVTDQEYTSKEIADKIKVFIEALSSDVKSI